MNSGFGRVCLGLGLIGLCAASPVATARRQRSPTRVRPWSLAVVPIQREVTDYVDFTGRTDAVESVDIRPRVTGYLVDMPFQGRARKSKRETCCLSSIRGPIRHSSTRPRDRSIFTRPSSTCPRRRTPATRTSPKRRARSACNNSIRTRPRWTRPTPKSRPIEASLEVYKLNLDFTKVMSPIDGQVSRYYLTLGNLVVQDQTLLTTVVSLDPMYAYFDMDEADAAAHSPGGQRRQDPGARRRGKCRCSWVCKARTGFPHQGDDQLRQQPGQSDHGQHLVPRRFPEPQAAERIPTVFARHVRAGSAADRPAALGRAGHRLGPSCPIRG